MRYSVVTEPSRPELLPALMPHGMKSPTSGFWGGANVMGQPGTVQVYSPKPDLPVNPACPWAQPSNCAPDYIMPSQYQSVPSNLWSHVRTRSDNTMPVPAGNLFNMAGVAMRGPWIGGQFQILQPAALQVWPDRNGGPVNALGNGNAGWKG